ncbi:MAG: carboxypeptidase-like regulatory domain-containing protein [Planctomycetota bacterium]|nr:carboxypeptidase-like regulatory domain-containing protein [Planctomycetota bacterium]
MPVRVGILGLAVALVALLVIWQPWTPTASDVELADRETSDADESMHVASGDADSSEAALRGTRAPVDVDETVARGPVTVTVRGMGGRSLASTPVLLVGPKTGSRTPERLDARSTDGRGVVVFEDVPFDGTHYAAILGEAVRGGDLGRTKPPPPPAGIFFNDGSEESWSRENLFDRSYLDELFPHRAKIEGPSVELAVRVGLPVDVRIERADTGVLIPDAAWRVGPRFAGSDAPRARVAVEENQRERVTLATDVPHGWILHDNPAWETWVTPRARSLAVRFPLRPEAWIVVQLPDGLRAPDVDALHGRIRISAQPHVPAGIELDGPGRLRIRGLPHLQGETVDVKIAFDESYVTGSASMGVDPAVPVVIETEAKRIDEDGVAFFAALYGHPTQRLIGFDLERALPMRGPRSQWPGAVSEDAEGGGSGRLELHVRRPDGTPAAGALVHLRVRSQTLRADREGRVLFRAVETGDLFPRVTGAGVPLEPSGLSVASGETRRITIQGHEGGRVALTVVDEGGDPVPYAQIGVKQPSGVDWVDLRDGVQRVDPYTNHRGERTLNHVEPGSVRVMARFGSRSGSKRVEVQKGRTARVRIVLGEDEK